MTFPDPAHYGSRAHPPLPRRRLRNAAVAAAALALACGMAACSAPAPTVSGPAGTASQAASSKGTAGVTSSDAPAPSSPAPSSPAAGKAEAMTAALKTLVSQTPQPSREQIRASLTAAGFVPGAVEVSASRTPTGLAADAVTAGVLDGDACLMAQVRSGTVESSTLPAMSGGRCFVGSDQR